MQKHVNLVDLVKRFPTNILLQNLASIQKRTSPVKFAHLAEKSGKGSISNLSTKAPYTNAAAPAEEPVFLAEQQPALEGSRFRQMTSGFMQGATNIAERITGRDLDGDGDVGTSGNIAAAMQKRR